MSFPGFPGGFDLEGMLKSAQEMQEKLQREMKDVKVEATVGGGMVTVQMSGDKQVLDVKLDPEAVKSGDIDMLQDMIVAAVNEAGRKVDEKLQGRLGSMLPPGLL